MAAPTTSLRLCLFLQRSRWPPGCQSTRRQLFQRVALAKLHVGVRFYTNRNIMRLQERGIIQSIVPEPDGRFREEMTKLHCLYAGFDPTANSLHIGNMVSLMALLHCQRGGHEVVAVVGGGTALIGDPSGKSTERPRLDIDTVERNASGLEHTIRTVFENHEKYFWKDATNSNPLHPLKILNNMAWYSKMSIVEFLSTVGRATRMRVMLNRQSVETRLASPEGLSFAEFSYQSCQAFDWLHLFDKYKCTFQVGGGDQLGNILGGYELISRVRKIQCHGLMTPLILSESGDKLGKSAGNAIWLNPQKTSPFDFYQFFVRQPDSEVELHLKLFTFLSLAEIQQIMDSHLKAPELRKAQKKVAELVTLLVHGESGLKSALLVTSVLFKGTPESLALLSEAEVKQVFSQTESLEMILQPGTTILQMALDAKCFPREVEARRTITEGGMSVNYRKVTNPDYVLIPNEHILPNGYSVIRVGKRNNYLVKWLM